MKKTIKFLVSVMFLTPLFLQAMDDQPKAKKLKFATEEVLKTATNDRVVSPQASISWSELLVIDYFKFLNVPADLYISLLMLAQYGYSPILCTAVRNNNFAMAALPLELGATKNYFDKSGRSRIYDSCFSALRAQFLVYHKVPPYASGSWYEKFADAVEHNDTKLAAQLVRYRPYIVKERSIENKGVKTVEPFVRYTVSLAKMFDKNGRNLLAVAARNKNARIAEMILFNANIIHCLHYLIMTNDESSLKFLLTKLNITFKKNDIEKLLDVTKKTKNISAAKKLLNDYVMMLESEKSESDLQEIEEMTTAHRPQSDAFTQPEEEFLIAIIQHKWNEAQRILRKDPSLRLQIMGIKRNDSNSVPQMIDILTFMLTERQESFQETYDFITYLFAYHFNKMYPLMQLMIKSNNKKAVELLLKLNIKVTICDPITKKVLLENVPLVNAHPMVPGTFEDPHCVPLSVAYRMPRSCDSLLRVALEHRVDLEREVASKQSIVSNISEMMALFNQISNNTCIVALLLGAGASIPDLFKERGYLLEECEISVLIQALEISGYDSLLVRSMKNTFSCWQSNRHFDIWQLGVVLFELINNPNQMTLWGLLPAPTTRPPTLTFKTPRMKSNKPVDITGVYSMSSETLSSSSSSSSSSHSQESLIVPVVSQTMPNIASSSSLSMTSRSSFVNSLLNILEVPQTAQSLFSNSFS